MTRKKFKHSAFSLVELMLSLIIISLIAAAFTPVITKKLNRGSIVAGGSTGEITNECNRGNSDGTYSFSSDCELCTKSYCITCNKSCSSGQYVTKKCQCSNCSDFDNDGISCKSCTQNGCSECESGYILNGKCKTCSTGKFCDGINESTSCPSEYYCENGQKYSCRNDKFGSACNTCTKDGCTNCDLYYGLVGIECKICSGYPSCFECPNDPNVCTNCNVGSLENGQCVWCNKSNCAYCNQDITKGCSICQGGYFSDLNGDCIECTKSNCATCEGGTKSTEQKCSQCSPGYYLTSDKSCKSCSDIPNCVNCTSEGKCIACKSGYVLNSSGSSCEIDDGTKFNCSDESFMKIGNLCFTRRNMGDSTDLAIPYDIPIRENKTKCQSSYSKCCWKSGSSNCDSANGDYSGCNRTVCNYAAAKAICSSFSYYKTGWRLPTWSEFDTYVNKTSDGLGNDGMQICNYGSKINTTYCHEESTCYSAYNNYCTAYASWTSDAENTVKMYTSVLHNGVYYMWDAPFSAALSVRCVLDMSD